MTHRSAQTQGCEGKPGTAYGRDVPSPDLEAVVATLLGYFELGNEVVAGERVRWVRNPACAEIYDANHGTAVRAATPGQIDAVLHEADVRYADLAHRTYKVDPGTPTAFEARLLLDGYEGEAELQLLLTGDLQAAPRPVDIRPVDAPADWASVARLTRRDHEEEAAKAQRAPYAPSVTTAMVATKRAKAPALRFFLARDQDGEDCAFFSSWPGPDGSGVGKVEDLFTAPEHRRKGIATALIAHAVDDARRRGAVEVLIGADPRDTPKAMYAALGFAPVLVLRSYTKRI
jgi:GNAT superfamily N-acetyltransferase